MTYKNTIQTKKNKVRMTNIQTRERDKLYEGRGGRRVYLKSENLLVFNIEFCTAINIEVFVELNSGLSDFNPFSSISYFLDLLKERKFGMKCSTWLNKF